MVRTVGRRILVTGLDTFWGGRVAQALEARPDVDVVLGLGTGSPSVALDRTEYVRSDQTYSILSRIVRAAKVDTIVHTFLIVDSTSMNARTLHELNVIGTMNLRTIEVEIRNLGRTPLSSKGSNPVRISYRWEPVLAGAQAQVDPGGTTGQPAANGSVTQDGAHEAVSMGTVEVDLDGSGSFRMPLSRVLLAGEKIRLRALLRAPDQPAQYRLIVTAVQEGVRWFDQVSASNAWSAIVNVVEDDSSTETKSINKPRRIDASAANSRRTGNGNSEASGQHTLAGRSPATHDDATRSTTLT